MTNTDPKLDAIYKEISSSEDPALVIEQEPVPLDDLEQFAKATGFDGDTEKGEDIK